MGTFQDMMASDVANVFLGGDFDVAITYTPQGGSPRTIRVQWMENIDPVFETGTASLDFDIAEIHASSVDNTNGIISPKEAGRGAQSGDLINKAGDARQWYLRKIEDSGVNSQANMHKMLIATSRAAFPNG